MSTEYKSLKELRKFIFDNDLMDNRSNVFFDASVSVSTSSSYTSNMQQVHVDLEGVYHGTIKIYGGNKFPELKPEDYPTVFWVNKVDIEIMDNNQLKIQGHHDKNPNIGDYTVIINPMK